MASARVGRFAPSPTGAMHLGNARTALLAWLRSRALGGQHLLRFEDLDSGRVRDWAYECTRRDLEWLGLDWDIEYRQSERLEYYGVALSGLEHYACTCTRKEVLAAIQESAGAPHTQEPVYSGHCRTGQANPDKPAALRWRIPAQTICVRDAGTAEQLCQFLPAEVGDMVLRRNDGVYAYHLAVVVDDALMGVSDVVRGADLWPATPRQVALQQALGYPTPAYWHVPLMMDYQGQRLAKRGGAPSVRDLRESGTSAQRVLATLARSLPQATGLALPDEVTVSELLKILPPLLFAPAAAASGSDPGAG